MGDILLKNEASIEPSDRSTGEIEFKSGRPRRVKGPKL